MYKALKIFVEGFEDELFFKKVVINQLEEQYDYVEIKQYSQEPQKGCVEIEKIIRSFKKMTEKISNTKMDYLYVRDINTVRCIPELKNKLKSSIRTIDKDRIIVVIKEIESWYLAGITQEECINLDIKFENNTNEVTKERFNQLTKSALEDSRINFMIKLLEKYQWDEAIRRNESLNYFDQKILRN